MSLFSRSLAALLATAMITTPALAQPASQPSTPAPMGPSTTAPGLGQPAAPTPPVPGVNAAPLTPEEREVLRDVEKQYDRFQEVADAHQARMKNILKLEYDQRTQELEKKYAARIAEVETQKKERHQHTIDLLRAFIVEHPDHEQFTPDAMFRLAALYEERARERTEGDIAVGLEPAIGLYRRLIKE